MGFAGETLVLPDIGLLEEFRGNRKIILAILLRRSIRHLSQIIPSCNSSYSDRELFLKTLVRAGYRVTQGVLELVAAVATAAIGVGFAPAGDFFTDDDYTPERRHHRKKKRRRR